MIMKFRLRGALLIAAAYVLLPVLAREFGWHGLDAAAVIRMNGVLVGAFLVLWANAIPKVLVPLDRLSCNPAREQAMRRLVGWVMVLGGVAYSLAFALAPAAVAARLAICLLAPAVLVAVLVGLRCAWSRRIAK
ncbi:hypothetical protein ACFJGW_14620 [Burkholderiaceae bacterium UC74_6]